MDLMSWDFLGKVKILRYKITTKKFFRSRLFYTVFYPTSKPSLLLKETKISEMCTRIKICTQPRNVYDNGQVLYEKKERNGSIED